MPPRVAALLGATLLAAGAAHAIETPDGLGACGPVARRHDHVELRVLTLRKLGRTPVDHVGVVARRDGRIVPIPFQIDERQGRTIAMADGDEPTADEKPGVLDPDDVLVMLPCDAGDPIAPEALATAVPGLTTWRAVRIDDPLDGARAFAYVVVADHLPTSPRRYVAYDSRADLVATAAYRIGMVQALPNYFALSLGHPLGPNLLDGLRLRAQGTLVGNLATLRLDEQDARHALIAWHAGPVRVARRSRHDVDLGIGIRLSSGIANSTFYPLVVYAPGSMKLPISPALFFRRITAFGGVDLRDLTGWRFVAPGTPPEGLAVDGRMDEVEQAFAADGTWFALVHEHEHEAVLVAITLSENLARAIPFAVAYLDDATRAAPPELERGSVPLAGFRGREIESLSADRYRFDLRVFMLPDYRPGDERRVLAERSTPLVMSVTGPAGPAGAPASPSSRCGWAGDRPRTGSRSCRPRS